MSAARAVGADVPVCLDPQPRVMRGVGEVLSRPLDLPALPAVLVNPGVALATRDVFARMIVERTESPVRDVPREFDALIEFLKEDGNDLTSAATACAPVVASLRTSLSTRRAKFSASGTSSAITANSNT